MAHLVQPVTVESESYCLKHGSLSHTAARRYRTVSFLSDGATLAVAEDDDLWVLTNSSNLTGEMAFKTCCIQTIDFNIEFDVDSVSTKGIVELYINGVLFAAVDNLSGTVAAQSIEVDMNAEGLIDIPCGVYFDFHAVEEDGETGAIAVRVTDVT